MFGALGFSEVAIMLILLLVVGAAFVAVLRALGGDRRNAGGDRARRILDERYASGEISRDEYERMRRDIKAG